MRFDDRLLTVLNQPAYDRHDSAVRWRQLLDLAARAGTEHDSPVVGDAIAVIRRQAPDIDIAVRAAAARSVAGLPLPAALLEYFASEQLLVAAPVLAGSQLDPDQWQSLRDAANEETLPLIASLQPAPEREIDYAAAPWPEPRTREVEELPEPSPSIDETPSLAAGVPEPVEPRAYVPPSLDEVVERIERRRMAREAVAESVSTESPSLFRWECDAGGEIAWVDGVPRGPLVGRSLARTSDGAGNRLDQELVRAFELRAPFRDAEMVVAGGGAAAGGWKLSGIPAFDAVDGRFAGYRGVAVRDRSPASATPVEPLPEALADPDSLRELVHEIRTPLNAILGFAEIIEGQYLGPADRGYRDRAAEIMRQARLLLTGIEDLDFAARVRSATGAERSRVDVAELVAGDVDELRRVAAPRGIDIAFAKPRRPVLAFVQSDLADRLIHRFAATVLQHAEQGERVQLITEPHGADARLSISRPHSLRGLTSAQLFEAAARGDEPAGTFPLRLVRGLARIAGGDLTAGPDSLVLILPAA